MGLYFAIVSINYLLLLDPTAPSKIRTHDSSGQLMYF